jgi:hypothetical protein
VIRQALSRGRQGQPALVTAALFAAVVGTQAILGGASSPASWKSTLYLLAGLLALLLSGTISDFWSEEEKRSPAERFRPLGLAALALLLYFALPFDIRGYMYYLNTRFAHLAAPLALSALPSLGPGATRLFALLAAASALAMGVPLAKGFAAFGREAAALDTLAEATGEKPMVMGLVFDTTSRVVKHPVYLHAGTVLARAKGGAANFSFALTPHSPLKYRGAPPPTFPSEWRPDQFDFGLHGPAYSHFLVRGPHPRQVFGRLLESELYVAAQADSFFLVRRK